MEYKSYLVQVVRSLKRSLATVAVIGGVLIVNVYLKQFFGFESPGAVFTVVPVIVHLVL